MGKGTPLHDILTSQANNVLPNGLTPSRVLLFPPTPVVNGKIYPDLIYPCDSPPKNINACSIPTSTG